ncbi:MAG TPA: hypothetical protein VEZ47_08525 [Gemmatirosa sp.]|nr:hypothetical protein [Gemmatirosa sp.]
MPPRLASVARRLRRLPGLIGLTGPLRAAAVLPALATLGMLAACERVAPRRSYVEQAVALAPDIERATGLRFRTPAKVEVRDRAQVRAFLTRTLDEPDARAELASQQALYRRLGMLGDSTDLRALLLRVLDEQVVGWYDPRTKTLYVVQGADSASAEVTLRHELVHALQDQYVNLDSLLRARGQNDRTAAAQAALEGMATWVQMGTGDELAARAPGAWERVRGAIRENMERMPALSAAPLVVRETLLFPYLSGAEFARRLTTAGHADSALLRLPVSTEQVLHARAYAGGGKRPDAPVQVALPRLPGTVVGENTLGEFETRLLLFHHTNDLNLAARAAAGWAGDRWYLMGLPGGGEGLAWLTVWDTDADAAEFYDALGTVAGARYRGATTTAGATPTTRVVTAAGAPGGPRSVSVRALSVQGRPAVLLTDAPQGVAFAVDVQRVTLAR